MSERVIRQRNIIHQLKEEKQGRIRAQQALEGTYIAPILSMITYGKTHFFFPFRACTSSKQKNFRAARKPALEKSW
jgi:hypothetical protein